LALTPSTQALVKESRCLEQLRAHVQLRTGVESWEPADFERIKPRTLVMVVTVALGLWVLLPQLVGASDVWAKTLDANLGWAAAALAMSVMSYIGAAICLDGSVPQRLPVRANLETQLATSFVGVAAPGASSVLTVRCLQRRGIDPAVAVAGVAIDVAAGGVVRFILLAAVLAWAGSSGVQSFDLPSQGLVVTIAVATGALVCLVTVVPFVRMRVAARVMSSVRRALRGVADTARQPANLVALFGGSVLLFRLTTFWITLLPGWLAFAHLQRTGDL
jgi:glycosyltransferase 2 family protein